MKKCPFCHSDNMKFDKKEEYRSWRNKPLKGVYTCQNCTNKSFSNQ